MPNDEINVLNNTNYVPPEVPKEQERINVSNIPPKSIGQRELDDTVLTETSTNTLTNKTLTAPVISTISNTGTLTLPISTDTLVGRDTTDTLTNKTLTSPVINNATFTGGGALLSKIIVSTRDLTASTGNVAYTGVGFQPTVIIAFGGVGAKTGGGKGFIDSLGITRALNTGANGLFYPQNNLFAIEPDTAGALQTATFVSFDSDGFTLTWTKTGSPTGTADLFFLCLK